MGHIFLIQCFDLSPTPRRLDIAMGTPVLASLAMLRGPSENPRRRISDAMVDQSPIALVSV